MQANLDRDVIVSPANEYEVLQLLLSDCRDRMSSFNGGCSMTIAAQHAVRQASGSAFVLSPTGQATGPQCSTTECNAVMIEWSAKLVVRLCDNYCGKLCLATRCLAES